MDLFIFFSSSCLKISISVLLLLSVLSIYIVNCEELLEHDDNIIFIRKDNLSRSVSRYLKFTHAVNNRATVDNKIEANNIIKYDGYSYYSISHSLETTAALTMPWTALSHKGEYKKYSNYLNSSHSRTSDQFGINHNLSKHINIGLSYQNQSSNSMTLDDKYLLRIVMEGLGLQKLPDFRKANISQVEYITKYKEYLNQVHEREQRERNRLNVSRYSEYAERNTSLALISIPHNYSGTKLNRRRRSPHKKSLQRNRIYLTFPLNIDYELEASDIEEANIRLLLITSPALVYSHKRRRTQLYTNVSNRKTAHTNATDNRLHKHLLSLKVYQILGPNRKVCIDGRKIEINFTTNSVETISQWIQFDVIKAVESWLIDKQQNLGLEITCDNCFRNGARIIDDLYENNETDVSVNSEFDLTPVLNIVGRLGIHREKRSKHYHKQITEKTQRRHKNDCYKNKERCCRHSMEVAFKDIKDFEFIIQPKVFDAGYCQGRCPPRFNPAHHHALLQSLIWKQDHTKVPRPCCAPSKLIELDVLHVDEKDNKKLKISTWTDMRVLECACS